MWKIRLITFNGKVFSGTYDDITLTDESLLLWKDGKVKGFNIEELSDMQLTKVS